MTAQPEHAPGPMPAIPHTINGIGAALADEKRSKFFTEVLAADEANVAAVMHRWWKIATIDRVPGVEISRENARLGKNQWS